MYQTPKKAPRSLVRPLPAGGARVPTLPVPKARVPGAGGLARPVRGRTKY